MNSIRRRLQPSRVYAAARFVLFFVLASSLFLPTGDPVRAAIDLGSFTATPQDGSVLIEWETVTEFDIAGFQVLRSDQENGDFSEISPFIQAEGAGVTGYQYEYTDEDVTNGVTYYYRLQSIDPNDHREEYDQTISATPGSDTPTPTETQTGDSPTPTDTTTPTPSDTPTLTPTDDSYPPPATIPPPTPYPGIATTAPSPTSVNAYPEPATRTPTRVPTSASNLTPSPTSPLITETPVQTSAAASFPLTITQVTSPTATLLPFPTITLEFPATALAAAPQSRPLQAETASQQDRGFSRYLPLGFILLIWLILGVWFYYSSRSLE